MATIRGGEKLERAMAELARKVSKPASLRVGFLENARYADGTPVAMIAAINEYGAPSRNQPPRPFFRRMIDAKQGEWPEALATLLVQTDYDAAKALDVAGAAIAGQLRESITTLVDPPLAPSTIRKKGFAKPLIGGVTKNSQGGHMLKSVDHEVKT